VGGGLPDTGPSLHPQARFHARRDAKAFAATVETSKLRGEFVSASVGKTTLGELGPAWLERVRGHLKPSSHSSYELNWRRNVEPRWGDVRIADIRRTDVTAWLASQTLSSATV